ncbi:hypothetical protein C8R44DRAFT_845471 [Mycena epipterygia]|nr:hypothetical protein C8R44DRAFT_845471 [Mycena epipterygia]
MSGQKFTVYLPKQGVRVLSLDIDLTVSEVISIIIDRQLYGGQFVWSHNPRIYQPADLQFDEDEQVMLQKAHTYLNTQPSKMADLRLLRFFFGDGPRNPDGQIDLFLMSDAIVTNRLISLDGQVPRSELVDYLYDAAQESKTFLVQGTPGSGKTTLCRLLFNHIIAKEPESRVSVTGIWREQKEANPNNRVEDSFTASCARGDQEFDLQSVRVRKRHWILMDDAQTTYSDYGLWSNFLKNPYDGFFIVLFASYGSQRPPGVVAHSVGTPNNFLPHQCVGLCPKKNSMVDAEEIPGLYFLLAEYHQFIAIKKLKDPNLPVIEPDLLDWIFQVSSGHIGAIDSIIFGIKFVAKFHRGKPFSLASFFSACDGPQKMLEHCVRGPAFDRGLPTLQRLKDGWNISAVSFLQTLLASGGPLTFEFANQPSGAMLAHQLGWITLVVDQQNAGFRADFPSLIHRSRVSYLLNGLEALPTSIQNMSLLQFVVAVIGTFSSTALSKAARHTSGPNARPSFPEAHFQNEMYTAAWRLTGGQGLWLSPEFGTPRTTSPSGHIDFFVTGTNSWGIEVLREDDRIEDHMKRFEPGGAYHSWIANQTLSDYVILDFRVNTTAMESFPRLEHTKLFHVSFQDEFNGFTIRDCHLNVHSEGTLLP